MYSQTPDILRLCSSISEKLGEIKARFPIIIPSNSQKQVRIDSIYATLKLDGQALSREKIAALAKNNPVRGPQNLLRKTINTLEIYHKLFKRINPLKEDHFLGVHLKLMSGLSEKPGSYRDTDVPIFRGTERIHLAKPPEEVPRIMKKMFVYLNHGKDLLLIKSCLAHYQIESSQPFEQASGIMSRLWQSVLLMQEHQLFEFLPFENFLLQNRKGYFRALTESNLASDAAIFIEFMLHMIDESLAIYLHTLPRLVTDSDRILNFHHIGMQSFTRKDYMGIFKNISSATASRDLEKGVDAGLFEKTGTKNRTIYSCQKP